MAVIWGLAFVASRIALDEFSPALMTALRFAIAAVPCLFVRKPDVSWPLLDRDQLHAVPRTVSGAGLWPSRMAFPSALSSVIVQSQALFTIAFAAIAVPRNADARGKRSASASPPSGLLMICGTVGYDFSVGAFAVLMISPVSFAVGNLSAAAGAGRADVRPVRLALPGRGGAAAWR